jgi:hypothetical protein
MRIRIQKYDAAPALALYLLVQFDKMAKQTHFTGMMNL